jgi:hypothetical protein
MRTRIIILVFCTLLSLPGSLLAMDLTGAWKCNDGGTYYLRQFGNELWWYGEQSPRNPAWSNIAHGTIEGNILTLRWTDVPKGEIMNHGELILEITPKGKIVARDKTGGFGGSVWTQFR